MIRFVNWHGAGKFNSRKCSIGLRKLKCWKSATNGKRSGQNRLLNDVNARAELKPVKTGIAAVDKMGMLEIGYYSLQLKRIGEGKAPDPGLSPLLAIPLLGFNYTSGILGRMFR